MDDPPIRSRPYSTAACCEKCVFDRGEHAAWCALHRSLDPDLQRKLHRVILDGYAGFEEEMRGKSAEKITELQNFLLYSYADFRGEEALGNLTKKQIEDNIQLR